MNTTLAELKPDQDSIHEDEPEDPPSLPSNTTVLWDAVTQLDNKLLNNANKVRPVKNLFLSSSEICLRRGSHVKVCSCAG